MTGGHGDEAARGLLGEAWRDFARRIGDSAATVAGAGFADNERDLAEGHRYLARLIAFAIQEAFCFSDPDFPAFHRGLDPLAPWGAPNVDNIYSTAVIDGRHAYRVWGNVASIDGFILNLNEGVFPVFPGFRTSQEISSRELQIGANGEFELLLSAERPADWNGNWMPLQPADQKFSIRQYLTDWDRHQPADLHIARVGNEGAAPLPLNAARTAAALSEAVGWAQTLASYYLKRLDSERAERTVNVLPPPVRKVPGSAYTHYGIAFFDLADDEALLIEMPVLPAPYWSFQIYNLWNEFTDPFNRLTSVNHRQAQIDDDGVLRLVIAYRDPGTANWLDTAGQRRGYLWYRWVWADAVPTPVATLTKLGALQGLLPTGTKRCDAAARRAQIAGRRQHLESRYYR
ncbi:MAG: DUF1214 domain-containing protein [Solimonas sp.]